MTLRGEGHSPEGIVKHMTQPTGNTISITLVNPALTLHVDVNVFGCHHPFLVDTGAAITLMDSSLLKQNGTAALQPITRHKLVGVSGMPLHTLGSTIIEIKVKGISLQVPVVVVEGLTADGILGLDFLKAHRCRIDIESQTLHLQQPAISILMYPCTRSVPSPTTVDTVEVLIAETVVVPAKSEMEVRATTAGPPVGSSHTSTWLIENLPTSKTKAIVARSLVSLQQSNLQPSFVTRVINPTLEDVTLSKDTSIATMQHITVDSVEEPPPSAGSERKHNILWNMVQQADGLKDEEAQELFQLLLSFEDVFATDSDDLGRTNLVKHTIDTGSAPPIRMQPRRLPPHCREQAQALVNRMLQGGIIQPSASPWSSPVVLVKKKDGSLRFCVDYRRINSITRHDAYPLPHINDMLDTLAGSQWFTTIDLLSGYWQVEMDERDREKTAFSTQGGLYEFKVLPFGLTNAPATFQRLMDMVLAGLHWSHCLVYIDDVIVLGRTFQDHLSNIALVLQRLRSAGLKVKPGKCELLKRKVSFLGHVVSAEGIATDPTKIEKVLRWPVPNTRREVQQFLGLANYYRRFVPEFAAITKPLHRLTEKNCPFQWSSVCQHAFDTLREKLVSPPILAYPDYTKEFILDTDASDVAVGAVLSQIQDDGTERVIAYASRVLSKSERRYSVTRRELLAMVTFISYFRQYLLGRHFQLRTDHSSLTWLRNFRNPEGQLARWLEQLEEYSFTVKHRPRKYHTNADALSRLPAGSSAEISAITHNSNLPLSLLGMDKVEMHKLQADDPIIGYVLQSKEAGCKPPANEVQGKGYRTRKLMQIWDQLSLIDGILVRHYVHLLSNFTTIN